MAPFIERYRWFIVAALAAPLFIALGFLIEDRTDDPEPLAFDVEPGEVGVYVTGEVQKPGVYRLTDDARWIDALEAAGGPTASADLQRINLATRVHDEDQISVPRYGEPAPAAEAVVQGPITNINTATAAQLDALPGIGEVRSNAIVQSRTTQGPFTNTGELVDRGLIPRSVYEDIKGSISVGP